MATSHPLLADSKAWRANNHSNSKVKVFWTADGCLGVKPVCSGDYSLTSVCKTEILNPGQSAQYNFPTGTDYKKKSVCRMDNHKKAMGDTSDRKWNGIRINSKGAPEWYDE